MVDKTKTEKSKRVSMSKRKLAETADGLEVAAALMGLGGAVQVVEGANDLKAAGELADFSSAELASGASHLTRAVDAQIVAERMATLSGAVAEAGVVDMAQGAAMLAASNDVGVMSALVGLMSLEDVDHGLELARLAGELNVVSEIVHGLQMPVLSDFLESRGASLHQMAVNQIRLAGSTRNLAYAMADTSQQITGFGEDEMAEGVARLAVSEGMAERSTELAVGAAMLAEKGIEEVATAAVTSEIAREIAAKGAADIAIGSEQLGAAAATEEFAKALEDKAT